MEWMQWMQWTQSDDLCIHVNYTVFLTPTAHSGCSLSMYRDIHSHRSVSLNLFASVGDGAENMNHRSDTQAVYTVHVFISKTTTF